MKKILTIFFAIFCIAGILYLALPGYSFPVPPPDSIKSEEPADLESPLRRGYFTNYSRAEVLAWYKKQFDYSPLLNIKLPTLLLNYPPEYAQTIIRDQTGSTYLQEFTHPFRESLYINGFETPESNLQLLFYVDGKFWYQKIIIRQVPSNVFIREGIFIVSMVMVVILYNGFEKLIRRKKNE